MKEEIIRLLKKEGQLSDEAIHEIQQMEIIDFADFVKVFLVTDVNGVPQICTYDISEMNKLDKTINSITYKDRN